MNITIFHYHLNPGGVTRIIESQVAGMVTENPNAKIQIITGHCDNIEYYKKKGIDVVVNEYFNYLKIKEYNENEINHLFNKIYKLFRASISSNEILHVHNINLGKNPVVTLAVNKLLSDGHIVFNHAHDFAEDRYVNMDFMKHIISDVKGEELAQIMYPNDKNYLIGVLNGFDLERTISYGIPAKRVFLLPNPVSIPHPKTLDKNSSKEKITQVFKIAKDKKIITYPVRVIRRKNIGELILLAHLFRKVAVFMVTMAPKNPVEIKHYIRWKQFCANIGIDNIIFEAGEKIDFVTLINGSDMCITTSRQEGFGMVFLEPWLLDTPVIGRNIDYVTNDLKKSGVDLPYLYDNLYVPVKGEKLDFKDIEPEKQKQIIEQIINKTVKEDTLFDLNRYLFNLLNLNKPEVISQNKKIIKTHYSTYNYAKKIYSAYSTVY